ncbi:uncharacterized protein EV420DRAFT_1638532 [Desarmillaria tabescens]|uniref:GPI anchored protein n=1 Tax=Armillaria tabescens TaxID=1929756 RepID=A0AA39TZ61_ARMTA|nr:uncharacterized protein EV420DRAFT_1638532 [Desarmillaria tabescens]KAK0463605.1 hypothetical protein EV420DRAFT_1638532 [Desarmillaria tabescens]
MQRLSLFFVTVAGLQGALGQTSLYVPGFDSQALSVEVAGVADGHTTFLIQPGSDATDGFVGTATLVEGSDYASLTYVAPDATSGFTVGYECSIAAGVAVCSGVADGVTILETETVSAFSVEGGATSTAAGTVATGSSHSGSSSATAKAGSGSSSGTATSTGTSAAASSTHSNSSSAISASSQTVMGAMGVLLGLMSML